MTIDDMLDSKDSWDWEEIERALKSDHPEQVASALNTVEHFAESVPKFLPHAVRCLTHSDEKVRRQACETLGGFGALSVDYIPTLINILKEDVPLVGTMALEALGKIGRHDPSKVLPTIQQALTHQEREVRLSAYCAVREMGPHAASLTEAMIQALDDDQTSGGGMDWPNCSIVPSVLGAIGEAAVPIVLERLHQQKNDPSWDVLASLTALGPLAIEALPILKRLEASAQKLHDVHFIPSPTYPSPWIQTLPGFTLYWQRKMERYEKERERFDIHEVKMRIFDLRRARHAVEGTGDST